MTKKTEPTLAGVFVRDTLGNSISHLNHLAKEGMFADVDMCIERLIECASGAVLRKLLAKGRADARQRNWKHVPEEVELEMLKRR